MLRALVFIAIVSIIFCCIPFLLHSDFSELSSDHRSVLVAFDSGGLKLVLCSCISLSIPLLLEIGRDCVLAKSTRIKNNIITNLLLVSSLIIPDVILFAYVVPKSDFRLFICVNQGRAIALVSSVYAYLIIFGGEYFQNRIHMGWYILTVAGNLLYLWEAFGLSDLGRIKYWSGTICILMAMGIFSLASLKWFLKQYREKLSQGHLLSTDEYCCNIYIISSVLCYSGLILTWFAFGKPKFSKFSSIYLIVTNIFYALFYVVISVFQGGLARRDEIIENSLKVKKKFVRYISHEIRTPLNAVSMGLKFLCDELPKYIQDPDILDTVATSRGACSASINILTDLLTFDKIEDGQLKLDRQEVSVKELVQSSTAIFQAQAREKGISLTVEVDLHPRLTTNARQVRDHNIVELGPLAASDDPGGDLNAFVDRAKMSQVIHNLVSNGLKFTPPGGRVSVSVSLENEYGAHNSNANQQDSRFPLHEGTYRRSLAHQVVRVTVRDTGVGLSQENMKKLFRQVIQFNPEVLQAGGGSGLGLFISKSIMDLHGGAITVASDGENRGSVFTVTFPLKPPEHNRRSITVRNSFIDFRMIGRASLRPTCAQVSPDEEVPAVYPDTRAIGCQLSDGEDKAEEEGRLGVRDQEEVTVRLVAPQPQGIVTHDEHQLLSNGQLSSCTLVTRPPDTQALPMALQSHFGVPLTVSSECMHSTSRVLLEHAEEKRGDSLRDGNNPHSRSSFLPRVLVVDDAISNRKMLCRVLRSRCSSIAEADNGQKAVDIVKESMLSFDSPTVGQKYEFDLILMDFVMPVMDGPAAIKIIRSLGYRGLIFGLTGNVLESDKDHLLASGANVVLTKPFDLDAFDGAMLESRRQNI